VRVRPDIERGSDEELDSFNDWIDVWAIEHQGATQEERSAACSFWRRK
jgi:hypothetical protein